MNFTTFQKSYLESLRDVFDYYSEMANRLDARSIVCSKKNVSRVCRSAFWEGALWHLWEDRVKCRADVEVD